MLIAKAAATVVPGGLLVVSDVFTDEGGATPAFAALLGVNMPHRVVMAIEGAR